ncbi:MAG: hypothetical protein ACQESD_08085 [Thermoplasmatota archaeon]
MVKKKKLVALALTIAILISVFGFYIWYTNYRPWTIEELDNALVDKYDFRGEIEVDDSEYKEPHFKNALAGEKRVVKGKVTDITSNVTTQGKVNMIELDDYEKLNLVEWDECPYSVGDEIEKEIHFEKIRWNKKEYVHSPEVGFHYLLSLSGAEVNDAVNEVGGLDYSVTEDGESVRITILNISDEYVAPLNIHNTSVCMVLGGKGPRCDYSMFSSNYENCTVISEIDSLDNADSKDTDIVYINKNDTSRLDEGDYFEITGINQPESEGIIYTYHFVIEQNDGGSWPCYLVFTDEGLLRIKR